MWNKIKYKIYQFMVGRYGGNDALNKALLWGYLIVLFVGALTGLKWLWYVGPVAIIWNVYRMFSRNIAARQKENAAFLRLKTRVGVFFKGLFDRQHVYRSCPHCKAQLRLPRKKGVHTVACPKCRRDFKVKI